MNTILSFENFRNWLRLNEAADQAVTAVQSALKAKGYGQLLGTTGQNKDGVDGVMGSNTTAAIKKFQQDNGLTVDGIVGPKTATKLGVQPLKGKAEGQPWTKPFQTAGSKPASQAKPQQSAQPQAQANKSQATQPQTAKPQANISIPGASKQVNAQLNYLKSIGYAKPFTILDDKNAKVYAINADYTLNKEYKVITGRDKGDEVKTMTFKSWLKDNLSNKLVTFASTWWNKSLADAANELDNCYFENQIFRTRDTPAGVFKRRSGVGAWLTDRIAVAFAEKDYGKRYISWETLDGKEITSGFHGTKNPERIDLTKDDFTKKVCSRGRKFSFGCINFKDADITTIDKFITAGQLSFWLPDTTNDIVKIPQNAINNTTQSAYQKYKEQPRTTEPGKI